MVPVVVVVVIVRACVVVQVFHVPQLSDGGSSIVRGWSCVMRGWSKSCRTDTNSNDQTFRASPSNRPNEMFEQGFFVLAGKLR
jgi:hypothetical protein